MKCDSTNRIVRIGLLHPRWIILMHWKRVGCEKLMGAIKTFTKNSKHKPWVLLFSFVIPKLGFEPFRNQLQLGLASSPIGNWFRNPFPSTRRIPFEEKKTPKKQKKQQPSFVVMSTNQKLNEIKTKYNNFNSNS